MERISPLCEHKSMSEVTKGIVAIHFWLHVSFFGVNLHICIMPNFPTRYLVRKFLICRRRRKNALEVLTREIRSNYFHVLSYAKFVKKITFFYFSDQNNGSSQQFWIDLLVDPAHDLIYQLCDIWFSSIISETIYLIPTSLLMNKRRVN
jgi:hypothetical protein